MSRITYVERKNTNCNKWDGQTDNFGEEGLLPLWVADMDFQVPACVQDALHDYITQGVFGYYKVPDSYYMAFINWMKQVHRFAPKKEWLRFSPGVVSAFNWIIQFMTKPGDSIIVLTPVYYPFLNAVKNNNRKLITSELVNTDGSYEINFEDFENKIVENHVSLFIHCSPHNPVGRVWKEEEPVKLLEICRKHNVFVISDEIHQDIVFGEHTQVPALSIDGYSDMVITVTAPSKTFNLAGCQNSIILIADEKLQQKWDAFAMCLGIKGGNNFGYIATTAAYTDGLEWFCEVKELIYHNYTYMKNTLQQALPKIVISPLEGTYLAWIDMKDYVKKEDMQEFMQKKCKLAFDYGDWFGGEQFGTFIRMNLATSLENVKTAVTAIIENWDLEWDLVE